MAHKMEPLILGETMRDMNRDAESQLKYLNKLIRESTHDDPRLSSHKKEAVNVEKGAKTAMQASNILVTLIDVIVNQVFDEIAKSLHGSDDVAKGLMAACFEIGHAKRERVFDFTRRSFNMSIFGYEPDFEQDVEKIGTEWSAKDIKEQIREIALEAAVEEAKSSIDDLAYAVEHK